MFATYGESKLPTIKTNAGPLEISNWKKMPEVKTSYDNLFNKMNNNDNKSPLMISRIIEKVFLEKQYSNAEMAYVIAICTTMLNPKQDTLHLNESIMKRKVNYYLVGFYFYGI